MITARCAFSQRPVPGVSTEGGAGARSQLWVGSVILNKILGVVPKREFSLPKLEKYSQNGTTPRNLTPFWHPIFLLN